MSYRNEYSRVEQDAYWTLPRIVGFLAVIITLTAALGVFSCAVGLLGGAATNTAGVIKKELYPDALLRKYEWFKDASAALDKKQADMKVYDARLTSLTEQYTGVKRGQWPRDDREQYSIWASEAAGVRASYNQLASEYNAQMSKLNWRFTNVGDLPPGAATPLPREYKPYVEN